VIVEVPDEEAGSVLMHNIIPRLSDTPGKLRRPAPSLGQHTREVLGEIGYSPDRIAALAADGVVKEG
jgi:crotonobetainyl-CoA:carnitine CoA-transferase CaiB-like acyl-CoA transferase